MNGSPAATARHTGRQSTPDRGIVLATVAVLVVLLQTLGMLHRLAHPAADEPPRLSRVAAEGDGARTAVERARAGKVPAFRHRFDGLFGTHSSGSADCRVFDHLLQLSFPGSAHPENLLAVSYAAPAADLGTPIVAPPAATYLARGPPTFA
jgi:hypothetical protein